MNTAIPRCPFCKTMLVGMFTEYSDPQGNQGRQLTWYCPMPVGLEHDRHPEPEWVYLEEAQS